MCVCERERERENGLAREGEREGHAITQLPCVKGSREEREMVHHFSVLGAKLSLQHAIREREVQRRGFEEVTHDMRPQQRPRLMFETGPVPSPAGGHEVRLLRERLELTCSLVATQPSTYRPDCAIAPFLRQHISQYVAHACRFVCMTRCFGRALATNLPAARCGCIIVARTIHWRLGGSDGGGVGWVDWCGRRFLPAQPLMSKASCARACKPPP